ncbi:MAG: cell division protein ZapA [Henriciella sp.]|uniref:cell division protein ZapA n=1 Tax=Henriciella sp. TaxID=1968823 RepID=UPI003C708E46
MPELILEIGGRVFDVACEAGQEKSLEQAARLLDTEARQIADSPAGATEKRMLLLSGLMLADSMATLRADMGKIEDRLRSAEERVRIAEAKSAMLAANALKQESHHSYTSPDQETEQLRAENDAAVELLSKVLEDINTLADAAEGKRR